MAFDTNNRVFNASSCGDNCAKWILQIASQKDLTINLRHIMDLGRVPFKAKILNNGRIVHNMNEFVMIAGDYVHSLIAVYLACFLTTQEKYFYPRPTCIFRI